MGAHKPVSEEKLSHRGVRAMKRQGAMKTLASWRPVNSYLLLTSPRSTRQAEAL